MQEQEAEQQKHSTQTLENIIMKTMATLEELQKKNAYWNSFGKAVCSALIAVLLVELAIVYFVPLEGHTFARSLPWVTVMILFAIVTMWMGNRLEQIFNVDTSKTLKESLTKTIADYRYTYRLWYIVYLFLFPAYFCAMIKLFLNPYWVLSTATTIWVCMVLTVLAFAGNYWYYKSKYDNRIKMLEENLKDLDN